MWLFLAGYLNVSYKANFNATGNHIKYNNCTIHFDKLTYSNYLNLHKFLYNTLAIIINTRQN